MATAEQLKSLIRTHYRNERERFSTIALQVAAHEALQGHQAVALEIRDLVGKAQALNDAAKVIPFTPELHHLIEIVESKIRINELVVSDVIRKRLERILLEYREREKLARHGMTYRRKILLSGPPGTGKTMTATVLATELRLPLFRIQLDKIVTKFMGETSAKLRLVFDGMRDQKGVYFFDEFDTIGGDRGLDNDVGEMRRVLNSFLQFIERDPSGSLIICATNNSSLLDKALFRRFDDILNYELPDATAARQLIENRLTTFLPAQFDSLRIQESLNGMSHADITRACLDAIKDAILSDSHVVVESLLKRALDERRP